MKNSHFDSTHWKNPRQTIANMYENNDYGYVFHAAAVFTDILKYANATVSEFAKFKVLDYGCGTGRIARQAALTGAHVEGYDPVPECIRESEAEFKKLGNKFKSPKILTDDFSKISDNFDIVYCVSVIEHLHINEITVAINNITQSLKNNGVCYIWVHVLKNKQFLQDIGILVQHTTGVAIIKGIKSNDLLTYTIQYE